MENKKFFFAVDLGATSGRTIIGTINEGKFDLEEVTRFPNNLIEQGGHYYSSNFPSAILPMMVRPLVAPRSTAKKYFLFSI